MASLGAVRLLFVFSALYDGVIGAAFLVAGPMLYQRFEVPPPNHWGYIHFAAALLVVFALMFLAVAARPVANRNLIPYGMLLKVSYGGTVAYHWLLAPQAGVPGLWKPFAIADLLFLVAFAWAYVRIGRAGRATTVVA